MAANVFGRTNIQVPPVWLSLSQPRNPPDGWMERLVGSALEAKVPIDLTSGPGLWGGAMRATDAFLTMVGNTDYERSTDDRHAADLVSAHLLQSLSSIGREHWDIYYLRVRRATEEYQISGALEALELAKQEGHIRYIGLCCDGPAFATLGMWQFHDAFEALMVPRNHYDSTAYETLAPVAKDRRVGVVTSRPLNWGYGLPFVRLPGPWRLRNLTQSFYGLTLAQAVVADLAKDHPVLVGVSDEKEVAQAIAAPSKPVPEGLDAMLQPFKEAWESDDEWAQLEKDEPAAFLRRMRDR